MRPMNRAAALCALLAAAACGEGSKAPEAGKAPAPAQVAGSPAPGPERQKIVASYDRGLDYLLTQQKDGIWSAQGNPDPGFTALAAASLLERPGGVREKDRPVVDKAVEFIAKGFADDGGVDTPVNRNSVPSAAVMALVAAGRPEDKATIEKAVAYTKKLQFLDESDPTYGGIGYGSDKTRSDLSNTQYALASLRAAGVSEDDPVFKEAVKFLDRTQNRKENEAPGEPGEWKDPKTGKVLVRSNDGGANYRPGDSKAGVDEAPDGKGVLRSYGSMTYALLRCYHLAGVDRDDGRVESAVEWISKNWILDRNPGMPADQAGDGLFYYYATIGKTLPVMGIDTITAPGGAKIDWRASLAEHLLKIQAADGSWASPNPRWFESMPVLGTAYALTALQACAR